MSEKNPRLILVFSGKRKSGKDYITESLRKRYMSWYQTNIALVKLGSAMVGLNAGLQTAVLS